MAARKRKVVLTDDWKEAIRASMIMNRLYQCAIGEIEMTPDQMNAAKIVLAKILPDLNRIDQTLSGPEGKPVSIKVEFV